MSERDGYPPGVPCWVETLQMTPAGAQRFYAALFDWEIVGDESYAVARLGGRDVAGIGRGAAAAWVTHVRVARADAAAERVTAAGGRVVTPAFDVAPAGRLAVVADPLGATFCLWEPGIREGAQVVNEPGAWAMSALRTPDPDAAIAFYAAVFGWQADAWGPVTLLRQPGYIGGEPAQPVPRDVVAVLAADQAAEWAVDFWVADVEATVAAAKALGGSVLQGVHPRPPMRSAVLADAAGAAFSVSQVVGP